MANIFVRGLRSRNNLEGFVCYDRGEKKIRARPGSSDTCLEKEPLTVISYQLQITHEILSTYHLQDRKSDDSITLRLVAA